MSNTTILSGQYSPPGMGPTTIGAADIIYAINSDGKIQIIKSRYGHKGETDLLGLLEELLPYQDTYKPLLTEWIAKLKKLRAFQ